MTSESIATIDDAAARGEVLVSPISAWEIGLLVCKGRIWLDLEPLPWFERFLGLPGVRLTSLGVAAQSVLPFSPSRSMATLLIACSWRLRARCQPHWSPEMLGF